MGGGGSGGCGRLGGTEELSGGDDGEGTGWAEGILELDC